MTKLTKCLLFLLITLISTQTFAEKLFIDEFVWTDEDKLTFDLDQRITPTNPPAAPVRALAEFEPATAVVIRYPLGIPTSFVALLSQEIEVICSVSSSWEQTQAQNSFNSAGVNNDNLTFIIANTDSYWTRDYSSWFIIDGNQEVSVLNFEYNRPRPNDNLFPQVFAQEYDYNYYAMNIEQTGGNFMTDGYGIAASSHIAYTENGNNQTLVNTTMEQYMGITDYMVIQDPNETYIDHVDCWGKFLDVDKVLIREVPTSHSQYDELEAVANTFATTNCSWGYPYQVIRVYTPNDQPYSNSLILNDRVFVPQTGSSWDDDALETYENAMPGYRIFGVFNNTSNPWESTDALHCRTHEIFDQNMLTIQHYPKFGSVDDELITIEASIAALSGETIYSDSTLVYYKDIDDTEWQYTNLDYVDGNTWSAEIGPFTTNQVIQYYLHSADEAGNSENYPYIGAADPFEFIYTAQTGAMLPPVIEFTPLPEFDSLSLPINVVCTVTDPNNDISSVNLWTEVNGLEETLEFDNIGNDSYHLLWDFDYSTNQNNVINYRIFAEDQAGLEAFTPTYSLDFMVVANDNNEVEYANGFTSVYPNPFHDSLNIGFRSKSADQVIKIYNLKGQLVREVKSFAKANKKAKINWNGKDSSGRKVSSGIYYMVLENEESRDVRKVLFMK